MKNSNKILFVVAVAATFSMVSQASAQYRAVGDDGIAASPKLRQQIDERKKVARTPSTTMASVGYRAAGRDGIAASPKLRAQLDERRIVLSAPSTTVASVGYQATGRDGITASPKLRQQLDERGPQPIMIAPLK